MGTNSKIEWTDHTWNPWRGCTKVSPGCDNCYMFRNAKRYGMDASTVIQSSKRTLLAPVSIKWGSGDKVFVCSWSDFFHPGADKWRGNAWEIIGTRDDLIFLILTKRPERIAECLPSDWGEGWPNVWLGVTAENQEQADLRVPYLLSMIPAAKRFVSIEPMLGPVNLADVDLFKWFRDNGPPSMREYGPALRFNTLDSNDDLNNAVGFQTGEDIPTLDWVIVGGESGPKARPMHPGWVRQVRDQCAAAGVPFMFKQHGEWLSKSQGLRHHIGKYEWGCLSYDGTYVSTATTWNGRQEDSEDRECVIGRVGKKLAGCLLDGREWKEFPA